MALSRIWTAFILLALLAASAKFLFEPGQEQIFSSLVTGKSTDTIAARTVDAALVPAFHTGAVKATKDGCMGERKSSCHRRQFIVPCI